ncbi:MAG: YfcE family phosphodiesterase [Actinomycetota bacterium]
MRRLAAIGDIHGNLPALRAVLEAVRRAGLRHGVCTGDLVMRGTDPERCVRMLRDLGWPCVKGNTDAKVCDSPPRPADHPASLRKGSRSWTVRRLSKDSMRFLDGLPRHAAVSMGGHRVVVVHGDSRGGDEPIDEQTSDADLTALAGRLRADCIVTGHTHRPSIRRVGSLLVVNPGSVGEAVEGERRPSWAWLEVAGGRLVAHLERVDEPLALVRDRSVNHP